MTLARLCTILTSLLAVLVSALFYRISLDEWQRYSRLSEGLLTMGFAQTALEAAEKFSIERGPSNALLGDGSIGNAGLLLALVQARSRSDFILSGLVGRLEASDSRQERAALPVLYRAVKAIEVARGEIDSLAARPRTQRDATAVRHAVEAMFAVIPLLLEAHATLSANLSTLEDDVGETMSSARLAAELREFAGQLGSQFTPALTSNQPLEENELRAIEILRGRIMQLNELLQRSQLARPTDQRLQHALSEMTQRFFGLGLDFIDRMEAAGRKGPPYDIDAASFASQYVPNMTAIVGVRDVLVYEAFAIARNSRTEALQRLLTIVGLGGAILLLLAGTGLALQRRVLMPLVGAAQQLRDIAAGHLDREEPVTNRTDEVGAIQIALGVLRENALEKRQLERERQQLIDDLKKLSQTDYLTGILNRRAFTEVLRNSSLHTNTQHFSIAIILFDIDYFKSVNDNHGHDVGDQVLVEIAKLSQDLLRGGETFARYGGEEFIVLLAHVSRSGALQVAERLRIGIESANIKLQNGQDMRVTASFGVAVASNAQEDFDQLLRSADDALYAAKAQGRNQSIMAEGAFETDGLSGR